MRSGAFSSSYAVYASAPPPPTAASEATTATQNSARCRRGTARATPASADGSSTGVASVTGVAAVTVVALATGVGSVTGSRSDGWACSSGSAGIDMRVLLPDHALLGVPGRIVAHRARTGVVQPTGQLCTGS